MTDKAALRAAMLKRRSAMDERRREELSAAVAAHVTAWRVYRDAKAVFVYASMRGEADTHALIARMMRDGKTVCLPRVLGPGAMEAALYRSGDALVRGRAGAMEPPKAAPAVPRDALDLALVPAVAVTRAGDRLGFGGGYYDRYLARRALVKAALCFSFQVVDSLPAERYDIRMNFLITEKGILPC